jgi:DNA-binding transcriptional LysR family regulator
MIEDELRTGILESVLDQYVVKLPPYYLYCPEQNRRLEPLRLFIDFLASKRKIPAAS